MEAANEVAKRRIEEAYDRGRREAAAPLLDAIDDFDLALASLGADESAAAVEAGLRLSHGRMIDRLQIIGMETIYPLGETFDPFEHHALAAIPFDGFAEGTVCVVQRRGWRQGSLVVRPAVVMVATAGVVAITEPAVDEPLEVPAVAEPVEDLATCTSEPLPRPAVPVYPVRRRSFLRSWLT